MSNSTTIAVLASACLLVAFNGCGEGPQITKYQTPKEQPAASTTEQGGATNGGSGSKSMGPMAPSVGGAQASAGKGRMLAAIVPQDDRVWFFKLMGDDAGVAKQVESFDSFVRSVEFDGGQPKWSLPDGWKEKPGSGMRFATVNTGQPKLDVSVISLPTPQDVLENVNRWQGQLQSPSLTEDQLAKKAQQIEIGGQTATVVNLAGTLQAGGGAPFMRGGGPFSGGAGPMAKRELPSGHPPIGGSGGSAGGSTGGSGTKSASPGPAPDPGFQFTTPDDWEPGRVGGMRKLAFTTESDEGATEFTVITLPKAGGAVLPNVNRWRGQVGLEPVDQAGLADVTEEIEVSGLPATLIEMAGPEDSDAKAMSVVMAERDGIVWFYKLMGDAPAVAGQKKQFDAFIQSIEFPNP